MSARPDTAGRRKGKGFKKGIDQEEARRKREDNIIQLRQNKRDENLLKRRAGVSDPAVSLSSTANVNQSMAQKVVSLTYYIAALLSRDMF